MARALPAVLLLVALSGACAAPAGPPWSGAAPGAGFEQEDEEAEDDGGSVIAGVLLYLPNRILDVLDVVRARVRVGPGLALSARATEFADVFVGSYLSVYAGLPGPRGRVLPRLPVGIESKTGIEASVADATVEGPIGPDYGTFEFGLGVQLFLVGVDVGVEPFEILDLLAGLLTFDPADDDF